MPRAAFLVVSQEKGLSTGLMRTALICYLPFYCKIREPKSQRACLVRHTRALPAQGSGNYLGPLLPMLGPPRLGLWGQLCAGSLLVALTQFWCHFCGLCVMELLLDLLRSKTVTFYLGCSGLSPFRASDRQAWFWLHRRGVLWTDTRAWSWHPEPQTGLLIYCHFVRFSEEGTQRHSLLH